uniref:Uncharacterized protein n=1 Tax=Anguilla anguilla TaxID=7936 RepID=A0A0E9Q1T7_ANGAN
MHRPACREKLILE